MKSRLLAPISLTVLILAFSGLTAAQSATTATKLCLYPVKGTVRLVSSSTTKCAKGEKLLTLGTQGPRGPQGPEGPSGFPGETGPQGPRGLQGPAGANGTNGTNGANGATGPRGVQGDQGPRGLQGAAGATGPSLVVLDANNTFVGYLVDASINSISGRIGFLTVWSTAASRMVNFNMDGTIRAEPFDNYGAKFATEDCSGPAYLLSNNDSFIAGDVAVLDHSPGSNSWYDVTALTLGDGETLSFSSQLTAGDCSAVVTGTTLITGPLSAGSWYVLTPTTSPLPTIVGPLHIGVQ
ncbi:MAG: collagen alpha-3(V) chain [Actinomycetota bacterium]|jgi:hypothetical protein